MKRQTRIGTRRCRVPVHRTTAGGQWGHATLRPAWRSVAPNSAWPAVGPIAALPGAHAALARRFGAPSGSACRSRLCGEAEWGAEACRCEDE